MSTRPNYCFYPTLLDGFTRYATTTTEDYFYQDLEGKWHKNYNESEGTFHFSQEEVDTLLLQELLDKVNRVDGVPSEAASKGTIFNEIVDCIIGHKHPASKDVFIASAMNFNEFAYKVFGVPALYAVERATGNIISPNGEVIANEGDLPGDEILKPYSEIVAKIGKPFIYGAIDGFEFYFDPNLCRKGAAYFQGALSQYYTTATIDTAYGVVRLYGYIDELIRDKVFDIKTTSKTYTFGKYQKYWQRHVYPYCLIESGDCTDIKAFEFSVFHLKGGNANSPLITGDFYREVYDYDHEQSTEMIRQQCERFIEFLEEHRNEITDTKIFGQSD